MSVAPHDVLAYTIVSGAQVRATPALHKKREASMLRIALWHWPKDSGPFHLDRFCAADFVATHDAAA